MGKGCVRFKSLENLRTPALPIQSLLTSYFSTHSNGRG
jgi:hypothetical protein